MNKDKERPLSIPNVISYMAIPSLLNQRYPIVGDSFQTNQHRIIADKKVHLEILEQEKKDGDPFVIMGQVCQKFNVTIDQMRSESREMNIAKARQTGMYIMYKTTELAVRVVGNYFCRNHSTVTSSVKKITQLIEINDKFGKIASELIKPYKIRIR